MIAKILLFNAALVLIYMSLVFIVARRRQRLDTVDIAWGMGFVLIAWASYIQQATGRSLLMALLVSVWGLRLSIHIARRAEKRGEDPRYRRLSQKWHGNIWLRAFVSIFMVQGVLLLIVSLPISLATRTLLPGLGWLSIVGTIIWLGGFTVESIADRQLASFLSIQDHPPVLQSGLWRYSRHPNYFGELTQWWGISVIALQVSYGWCGLLGPLTLSLLIVFVSGIPTVEKRRQKDDAYQIYRRRTSVLIPLPPRR